MQNRIIPYLLAVFFLLIIFKQYANVANPKRPFDPKTTYSLLIQLFVFKSVEDLIMKIFTSVVTEKQRLTYDVVISGKSIVNLRQHYVRYLVFLLCLTLFYVQQVSANPACSPAQPQDCLYESDINVSIDLVEFDLMVTAIPNYMIPLRVYFPLNSIESRPAIIWNHGGDPSEDGRRRSMDWGQTLAAAGYVAIHPSRIPVPRPAQFRRQCKKNGFRSVRECERWIAQARVGPMNVRYIIDDLSIIETTIGVNIDASKIAVAGHSAGTIAVFSNAGAWQRWKPNGPIYSERDDRPVAFFATGPQGTMYANYLLAGFQSGDSFEPIDRPLALVTGVGDRTGEPPESRITAWLKSMQGNKYLSYDTNPAAVHETMNINVCDSDIQNLHCTWIASFGLAYFDAVLRERREAITWLQSDAYQILTNGEIELHRR